MDSRNENFTSWEWLICRIIPKEIVIPLLDMLENTENPCAIPIRKASSLLISLDPLLKNFVIKIKIPLIKKPTDNKKKS